MIAPEGWNVTIEDIAYRDGYRNAEADTYKFVIAKLWEKVRLIEKATPELAEGLQLAIDEIEKLEHLYI